MNYYSYVDTALRVIHINRRNDNTDGRAEKVRETFDSFKGSKDLKSKLITENIKFNLDLPEVNLLLIHESHHYWQSLFYPFLFYVNYLEYQSLSLMRLQMEDLPDLEVKLGSLFADPKMLYNLTYCVRNFRYCWSEDGKLEANEQDLNDNSKFEEDVFCLNDLIEDATTIFEFKAQHEDANANSFFLYIQSPKNKRYKKLYKFLYRRFGASYPYHFIPMLVQLAFHTTEPISMFCNLVNMTVFHGLDEEPFSAFDYGLMKAALEQNLKEIDFSIKEMLFIQDMPVGLIGRNFQRKIIDFAFGNDLTVHFPLSVHAQKCLDALENGSESEEALININVGHLSELLKKYYPFAIHFNFLDQNARNSAILMQSKDYEKIVIKGQELDYQFILTEQLNLQDTMLNLFSSIHRNTPHQCSHKECPYYQMLLCSKWNSIPLHFEDCRFPIWFPLHFFYKLSPKDNKLLKFDQAERETYETEYIRLRKAFGPDKFNFFYKGKKATLEIRKNTIDEKDYLFILDFINKQLNESSIEELSSFLTIVFPDFVDDKRQVFEIPQIRNYMNEVYTQYPSFFYFLDLSVVESQASYIFPFYVDFICNTDDDGSYSLILNKEGLEAFIIKLVYVIGEFAKQNDLDVVQTIEKFLKTINL